MIQRRLALSVALGATLTFGLVLTLSLNAGVAEAQLVRATTIEPGEVISEALAYLQTQQLDNGAIESGFTPGTADDFTTIKAVLALAAARRPVGTLTSASGHTLLDYLGTNAHTYTHDVTGTVYPGRLGMVVVAAVAGEADPYAFGQYPAGHSSAGAPMDLVSELQATYRPSGAYSTTAKGPFTSGEANATNQLWPIFGLAAAQETVPVTATEFFIDLQESDGGWAWVQGSGGDVDMTGLAIQALVGSGNVEPTSSEIQEALDFLRETQLDSGGWAGYFGNLSADSTAAAIQGLAAVGYTPATESWAASSGRTPQDDLLALQEADGSFADSALATAHAIAGLAEAPVPVLGRVQRANRALTWLQEQQNADGSWSGFSGPDPGATCDAVLAYAAAGFDPDSVTASGSSLSAMDYLSATASSFVTRSADSAAKLALAVEEAGMDTRNFGGVDIVDVLNNTWYSPTVGAFGDANNSWHQAFSILGLTAAGEPIPVSATRTLTGLQNANGSWTDAWGFDKPGSTGLALQAVVAAGVPVSDASVVSGVTALRNMQNTEGSWSAFGSPSASSTAYAIQGLLAAGEDLEDIAWLVEGHSPYDAFDDLQKADGPFVLGLVDDAFATRQAVPAQLGVSYPFTPSLESFTPVHRGADPDRTVAADLRAEWGNSMEIIVPFGSDLDADGSLNLEWREVGASSWETATLHRADGFYTATVTEKGLAPHQLRATFTDADGVQYGTALSATITLPSYTLEPNYTYLPIIVRGS